MFSLTIETDNAAFGETDTERATEIARILRKIADHLELGGDDAGPAIDSNGNRVGGFALTT